MARKKDFSIPFQPEQTGRPDSSAKPTDDVSAGGEDRSAGRERGEIETKTTRVNVRFAVILLVTAGAVAAAAHWVHSVQVKRSGETLLARANAHRSQGDLRQAIRYLRQYVDFVPDDVESLVTFSTLLEETAEGTKDWMAVFLTNERILRLDPSRSELRDRQVRIAIRLERFRDARVHLGELLGTNESENKADEAADEGDVAALPANEGELYFLLGMTHEAEGNFADAAKNYRKAVDRGFQGMEWFDRRIAAVDAYVLLANLYREQLKQPQRAEKLYDEMVAADPEAWEPYLARARDRIRRGDLERALEDVARAGQIAPNQPEVVLLTAELSMRRAGAADTDFEHIRQRLQTAISSHREDHRLYRTLAQLELAANGTDTALQVLRDGIEQSADDRDLIWLLADTLISKGKIEEAETQRKQLTKSNVFGDYLDARIEKQKGNLAKARRQLERVRTNAARQPELAVLAGVHLADCHGQMGNYEEQLDAARQAVDVNPNSLQAHLQMALALHSLGRLDDALEQYARLSALPDVLTQMARILFEKNLRMPTDERDWQAVEKALDAAEKTSTDPAAIRLLRVQVLQAAGDHQQARERLQRLQAEDPDDPHIWAARVLLAMNTARGNGDRSDNLDEAKTLLEEARTQVGDCLELRLARAAIWSRLATEEADEALQDLEERAGELSPQEQGRLLEDLANIRSSRGDVVGAHRLWKKIADLYPDHVRAQFRWFALSQQLISQQLANPGDDGEDSGPEADMLETDMNTALARLREIEGDQGPYVISAKALMLLEEARGGDAAVLDQARSLLDSLERSRPNWPLVPLCRARIDDDEFNGNLAEAAKNYQQAIELGFKDPIVILRTVYLLMGPLQRPDDAERVLGELRGNPSPHVQALRDRIAAHVALAQGNPELALERASDAIDPDAARASDYIWLGQLQAGLKKNDEAEESFRTAIKLSPTDAVPYVALVRLLAAADRLSDAEEIVKTAEQALPSESVDLALANCFEAMGRVEQAASHYRTAIETVKDRAGVKRQAAEFFLRSGQSAEAESLVWEIVDQKPPAPREIVMWARRTLASLVGRRSYLDFVKAGRLLDKNINEFRGQGNIDRLMKARLLATRPEPAHRRTAIQTLDALNQRGLLAVQDQLLLATLHDSLGEEHRASAQWSRLVNAHAEEPTLVAGYVRRQLEKKQYDDAGVWLETLEKLRPYSFTAVELKARLAVGQGKYTQAIALLEKYVDEDNPEQQERIQRLALTARLIDSFTQNRDIDDAARELAARDAESRYRDLINQRSDELLPFANLLARQQRLAEALDLCQRALASRPPFQVTAVGLTVLRQAGATPEEHEDQILRVQGWLDDALKQEPQSVVGLLQRAELYDFRGLYDKAEETHYQILELSPENVIALNNLAWLLSVRDGRHQEAEQKINEAIERAGSLASLLDTRGTILFNRGRLEQAKDSFQAAVSMQDSANRRLHLAAAFWKLNELPAARENWKRAEQQGLDRQRLHPLERELFDDLRELFDERNDATQ